MNNKIPKVIHYCWFGKGEKPKLIKKCIDSWEKILIGYEIKEWNEDNFNINCNEFVKQAYECRNFAFVSDFVRVYALYNYGGIYLDTDVEVFKPFDNLLNDESFWGFEEKNYIATSTIGAKKENKLIEKFLNSYNYQKFDSKNLTTNVAIITNMLRDLGVNLNNEYQEIKGVATFYPQEYFSPYDYINCYSKVTKNTYAMHHFHKSWLPMDEKIKSKIKKIIVFIIGGKNLAKIRTFFSN